MFPTTTTQPAPRVTARYRAAPRVTAPAAVVVTGDYHTWPDFGLWLELGRCEEPGGSPDGIAWATNTGVYVGGFAMAHSSYDQAAREIGAPLWNDDHDPNMAGVQIPNPSQQIIVARQGHYVDRMYWGCGRSVSGW